MVLGCIQGVALYSKRRLDRHDTQHKLRICLHAHSVTDRQELSCEHPWHNWNKITALCGFPRHSDDFTTSGSITPFTSSTDLFACVLELPLQQRDKNQSHSKAVLAKLKCIAAFPTASTVTNMSFTNTGCYHLIVIWSH